MLTFDSLSTEVGISTKKGTAKDMNINISSLQ